MPITISKIDHIIGAEVSERMDVYNPLYSNGLTKFLQENPDNSCGKILNNPNLKVYILGVIPSKGLKSSEDRTYMMTINPSDLDENERPAVNLFKFKTSIGTVGHSIDISSLASVDKLKLEKSLTDLSGNLHTKKPIFGEILTAGKKILEIMQIVQAHPVHRNSPRSVAETDEEEQTRRGPR